MTNATKPVTKFYISPANLEAEPAIGEAYQRYSDKRENFGLARVELNDSIKALHELLDGPLRAEGLVPQGKDWTLTEPDDSFGLIIQVWSESKGLGRRKQPLATQQVSFERRTAKVA